MELAKLPSAVERPHSSQIFAKAVGVPVDSQVREFAANSRTEPFIACNVWGDFPARKRETKWRMDAACTKLLVLQSSTGLTLTKFEFVSFTGGAAFCNLELWSEERSVSDVFDEVKDLCKINETKDKCQKDAGLPSLTPSPSWASWKRKDTCKVNETKDKCQKDAGSEFMPKGCEVRIHAKRMRGQSSNMVSSEETLQGEIDVNSQQGWRKLLAYLGPGFLVCIAYIDPGNFQNDLQSGAQFQYELLWIILVASFAALFIQSLAANLGVVTGKHLAEHCREEYSRPMIYVLWFLSELAVISADIPEVIGTAFALEILLHIPVWIGVLLTGVSTLILLALQQYGIRKLEFLIALLVLVMTICFFVELGYAKPDAKALLKGLFLPQLKGNGATGLAISLLGAMIMPHNLYLHSALVLTRKIARSDREIKDGCRYNFIESGFALSFAFLINVCIIAVSGAVCSSSKADLKSCDDLDLNQASFLLRNVLGRWSKVLFGVALLASGQSSTITGTYAGQYVMQGFLNLRFKPWVRNMITRSVAIVPSLIVALVSGAHGAGKLIVVVSMISSFVLPFVLIPLLKFTGNRMKMGPYSNSWVITIITWFIGGAVMTINVYFMASSFVKWLIHSKLPVGGRVVIGAVVCALILLYIAITLYLAFRREKKVTYLIAPAEANLEMIDNDFLDIDDHERNSKQLPRQDIAEMQLPR